MRYKRKAKRFERVDGKVVKRSSVKKRLDRVVEPPAYQGAGPCPLDKTNGHLIGQIIEFNDFYGKYHLAEIKGVAKVKPNSADARHLAQSEIQKAYGAGDINWDDLYRYRKTKTRTRASALKRKESMRPDYETWAWVVQGLLEEDMTVRDDGFAQRFYLLLPITFGTFIARPAVSPDTDNTIPEEWKQTRVSERKKAPRKITRITPPTLPCDEE